MDPVRVGHGVHRTERLLLVPIAVDTLTDLFDLHQDDGVAAWYGGRWSPGDAEAFAAKMEERWRVDGLGKWLAYDARSGCLIGRGGPSRTNVVSDDAVEIGWAVREAHWGRGYATEIGRASIDFVRASCRSSHIVAFTERHNRRSRAVMERLGMTHAGEIRRPGLIAGAEGVQDGAPFALYRLPGSDAVE